jgi:hypothetical protein
LSSPAVAAHVANASKHAAPAACADARLSCAVVRLDSVLATSVLAPSLALHAASNHPSEVTARNEAWIRMAERDMA